MQMYEALCALCPTSVPFTPTNIWALCLMECKKGVYGLFSALCALICDVRLVLCALQEQELEPCAVCLVQCKCRVLYLVSCAMCCVLRNNRELVPCAVCCVPCAVQVQGAIFNLKTLNPNLKP